MVISERRKKPSSCGLWEGDVVDGEGNVVLLKDEVNPKMVSSQEIIASSLGHECEPHMGREH